MSDTTEPDGGPLIYKSGIFTGARLARRPRPDLGTIEEPARSIPIFRDCDVLVVGGGPSGTAAAIAAARTGADVILLERHNHLGGLSTGGLVIWIDRMTDWTGQQVIRGIANDLLDRLPKDAVAGPLPGAWGNADEATAAYWKERTAAFHGIVTWSPTVDPEHLKLASQELVLAHDVQLIFHAWGAMPLMQDGAVAGVIFESKEGRKAIRASVTIDCTGDGDIFTAPAQPVIPTSTRATFTIASTPPSCSPALTCNAGWTSRQSAPMTSPLSRTAAEPPATACSNAHSSHGATTSPSSWGRGWQVIRR